MRGEMCEDLKSSAQNEEPVSVEKQQELLLMNKLASGGRLPPKTQSSFLQKKLQQRKFFDSGDYAMNQDKEKKHQRQPFAKTITEGKPLPAPPAPVTPVKVVEKEEVRIAPPPLVSEPSQQADSGSDEEEHLQIPRPENVPQRKASILHPSVHSKLSPQPHIHHEHNDDLSS
ncbi:unnamed protein product [Bursaphelenchus xylophilus]|uniref:(pine wood nematode) hypothetical protein n=1 Tax=Bursaphelenchus xylophilus TaxID=6326 RepID=A0A1I7SC23_BURXY|nr:unnamed protein product [Bursaphelenchus xylophilus]CAG9086429.1 unnamed protein product [Bursaphelenchus xylophilus]